MESAEDRIGAEVFGVGLCTTGNIPAGGVVNECELEGLESDSTICGSTSRSLGLSDGDSALGTEGAFGFMTDERERLCFERKLE